MPEDVGNNSSNNDNNTKLTQAEIIGIIIGTLVITGIFAMVISLIGIDKTPPSTLHADTTTFRA